MKNLKITVKEGIKLSKKITLFKQLFDFDSKNEVLEIRITGLVRNNNYGTDKVNYQLIEIKNNSIKFDSMDWEVRGDIILELLIYTK